jgi:hypothetical protein
MLPILPGVLPAGIVQFACPAMTQAGHFLAKRQKRIHDRMWEWVEWYGMDTSSPAGVRLAASTTPDAIRQERILPS